MRKKVLGTAATVLASLPATSFALGLGDIQLKSSLNAPLDAEIELVGATPEELVGLKVQLASRDTFARYGIDYPTFLNGISVRTARVANGRTVVQLRSSAAITEPFVTVLVEANYGRGRQVREYSVLLDPPVFAAPTTAAAAPVAAPAIGNGDRSGSVSRPAAAPPPVAAPAARPAVQDGGNYKVRGGDTLSRIASNIAGGSPADRRRAMVAIYRANPGAFDGNMNQLRSGAVLRLPDAAALAAIDPADAGAEIRRQSSSWQGSATADVARPAPASNQLKLVPPADTKATTPAPTSGSAPAAPSSQQLQQRLNELESQLAEARRALEQQRSAAPNASAGAPQTTAPAADAAKAEAPGAVVAPPAPEAKPAPVPVARKAPPAPAPQGPGIVDFIKTLWYVPAGLLALAAALFGLRALRRRRDEALDLSTALEEAADDADPHAITDVRSGAVATEDLLAQTQPLRIPNVGGRDDNFLVEEGRHATGNTTVSRKVQDVEAAAPPAPAARGSTSTRLPTVKAGTDQSDPIAEADFHMAYGLYDQAADLIRQSIQREPSRRDLKLKLLEIYFVWGNKAEFLSLATELSQSRDQGQAGEWDKILIMGRQLAPESSLFDSNQAKPVSVTVDHNLEGGQNQVDFDLLPVDGDGQVDSTGLDFDLGATKPAVVPAPVSPTVADGDTRLMPVGNAQGKAVPAELTQELAAFDDMGLDVGAMDTALHRALEDPQFEHSLGTSDATVRAPVADLKAPAHDIALDSSNEWQLLDGNAETLGVGDTLTSGLVELKPAAKSPSAADEPGSTQQLEPPSMSEIGTKLDLARAYIDMGDPDGARSILAEVLAEGGDAQKQEAQRLLDGIPG